MANGGFEGFSAYEQQRKDNGQGRGETLDAILCEHVKSHRIASIPPRRWAFGNFLLFGHPGVIGAIDGGGKGSLAVGIALSMITGRALLGERVWRKGPVAVITYEDDRQEWCRRIAAACIHYKLDYEAVIVHFHFIHRPGSRIRLAAPSPDGMIFPDGNEIIEHLKRIGAVLLIVDPFNHAHALEDGNNNVLIAQVAGEIARIAEESDAAVLALHHLRKGSVGDPDDLMGATSLRATFRSCRILRRMTADQAEKLGMPTNDAWRYSCIAGSKENYAPPPSRATWYRLEGVSLGNPDDLYTDGDNVQVAAAWVPPSPFADLPLDIIQSIFDAIRKGPGEGEHYAVDVRSDAWVGTPIVTISGKSDGEAKAIVNAWVETDVLTKGQYRSPKLRRLRGDVTLNEVKVAEILRPLSRQPDPE